MSKRASAEPSPPSSEDAGMMLQNLKDAVQKKRGKVRSQTLAAHDAEVESLRNRVEQAIAQHALKIRAVRETRIQQVIALVMRKAQIEAQIQGIHKKIIDAHNARTEQLFSIIDDRFNELP